MGSNPVTLKMRQANHIILDFESSKNVQSSQYWATNFFNNTTPQPNFLNYINFKNVLITKNLPFNSHNSTNDLNIELLFYKSYNSEASSHLNTTLNLININFLRKEKLYTKLKYSRSPAYDIVSGGAAALFAGFLGFLVSEKFGFELVDSGDFYFLTMYIVFICFSIRPLLTIIEPTKSVWTIFSLKPLLNFYIDFISMIFRSFK